MYRRDPHRPTDMMGPIAKPTKGSDWRSGGQLVLLLLRRLVDDQLEAEAPILAPSVPTATTA